MEAMVTLKMTVAELDLVRQAMRKLRDDCHDSAKDEDNTPQWRQKMRQTAILANNLVERLGS